MSDFDILKAELAAGHPDTGPYDADDAIAATEINAVNRTRKLQSMSGDEIFNTAVPAEFIALDTGQGNTQDAKNHWLAFCGRESIDPFAAMNVQFVIDVFGAASGTVSALQAARSPPASRATELGLVNVRAGTIGRARL